MARRHGQNAYLASDRGMTCHGNAKADDARVRQHVPKSRSVERLSRVLAEDKDNDDCAVVTGTGWDIVPVVDGLFLVVDSDIVISLLNARRQFDFFRAPFIFVLHLFLRVALIDGSDVLFIKESRAQQHCHM